MNAASSAKPKSAAAQGLGYNIVAIALALILAGIGLAYAIDAAGRQARVPQHRTDSETTLTRTLGGKELRIPLSWFRNSEERTEGFAREIELRLMLPLGPDRATRGIDVTLLPRSGVRASAALLDGVYLHKFTTEQREGAPGLIGKPLRPDGGYAAETVWYDPISAVPFVAKCEEALGAGSSRCLRSVHLAPGIAAVYAFDAEVLQNWRQFDETMRPYLTRIGAMEP